MWNSAKIKDIEHLVKSGNQEIIERDIKIDCVLGDTLEYPFLKLDNNFSNLRKTNVDFDYTEDEIRIINDIINPRELIKHTNLKPYEYQLDWLDSYQNHKKNVFLTTRQVGGSTISIFCMIHYIMTNPNKTVLFITKSDISSSYRILLSLLESIPFFLKLGIVDISHKEKGSSIYFDNGTTILLENYKLIKKYQRQYFDIGFLIVEDGGYIDKLSDILKKQPEYTMLYSNTVKNSYFNTLINDSLYNVNRVEWYKVPGRDNEWQSQMISNLGGSVNEFNKEYGLVI